MTPSNALSQLFRSSSYKMADPGNAATITVDRQFGVMSLVSATAETRTLAAPTKAGIFFSPMMVTDGGDITFAVTGTYDGTNTNITFDQVEDWVTLFSVETAPGVFRWRIAAAGGTALGLVQTISNLALTTLDIGSSGTAGNLDIFPATASRGKLNVAVTDQTGNTTVSLLVDAMAAARTIHLPDPGATAYVMMGASQITLAEAGVLSGATLGVVTASKAVTADASSKIGLARLGSAAASASGLLMGVGTTANPVSTSTANANLVEIRGKTTATSGDNRLGYFRYDIGGAGASGECLRALCDLTAVAANPNGGMISLQVGSTGYVSGRGAGCVSQLYLKNEAVGGGTLYGGLSEVYSAGSSSSLVATQHAIHSFQADGNATGAATCVNVWDIQATAAGDTTKAISSVSLAELPTGSLGIAVTINGTRYFIPAVLATEWN